MDDRMSEHFRIQLNELRHSLVPDIVPLEYYNHKKSRLRCSIAWLLSKVFDGHVPLEYEDPLIDEYTDEETSKTIELNPSVAALLTSGRAYADAATKILRQQPNASSLKLVGPSNGHTAVLTLLHQCGFYTVHDDGKNNLAKIESQLSLNNPIRASVHQSVIDAFMRAFLVNNFSTDRVTASIRSIAHLSSLEQPRSTEEALLLWISKVCHIVRARLEQDRRERSAQLTRQNGRSTVRLDEANAPVIPVVKDLLADISDGAALATLITHYCPDHLRISDVALKDPLGVADSCFNLEIVRLFSDHLDRAVYFFRLEDLLYMHSSFKPNVLVFLADMFSCLCSTPPLLCACSRPMTVPLSAMTASSMMTASKDSAVLLGESQNVNTKKVAMMQTRHSPSAAAVVGRDSHLLMSSNENNKNDNSPRQLPSSAKSHRTPPEMSSNYQTRSFSESELAVNLRGGDADGNHHSPAKSNGHNRTRDLLNEVEFSSDFSSNDHQQQQWQPAAIYTGGGGIQAGTVIVVADDDNLPPAPENILLPGSSATSPFPKRREVAARSAAAASRDATGFDVASNSPPVPPLIRQSSGVSSSGPAVSTSTNGSVILSHNNTDRQLTMSSYTVSDRRYTVESARQAGLPIVDGGSPDDNNRNSLLLMQESSTTSDRSYSPAADSETTADSQQNTRITWAQLQQQQKQQQHRLRQQQQQQQQQQDEENCSEDEEVNKVMTPKQSNGVVAMTNRSASVGSLTLKLQLERKRREAEQAKREAEERDSANRQRARDEALRTVLATGRHSDEQTVMTLSSRRSSDQSSVPGTWHVRSPRTAPVNEGYNARLEQLNQSLTDLHSQLRNLSSTNSPSTTTTKQQAKQHQHQQQQQQQQSLMGATYNQQAMSASALVPQQQPLLIYQTAPPLPGSTTAAYYQTAYAYSPAAQGMVPTLVPTLVTPSPMAATLDHQSAMLNNAAAMQSTQSLVLPGYAGANHYNSYNRSAFHNTTSQQQLAAFSPPSQLQYADSSSVISSLPGGDQPTTPSSVSANAAFFVPISGGPASLDSSSSARSATTHTHQFPVPELEEEEERPSEGVIVRRSQSLSAIANRLAASGSSSSLALLAQDARENVAFVVGDAVDADELERRRRQKCVEMEIKRKLEHSGKKDDGAVEAARRREQIRQQQDEQEKRRAEHRLKQKQVYEEYLQKKKADEDAVEMSRIADLRKATLPKSKSRDTISATMALSAAGIKATPTKGRRLGSAVSEHENLAALTDGNSTQRSGRSGRPPGSLSSRHTSVQDFGEASETASMIGADALSITAPATTRATTGLFLSTTPVAFPSYSSSNGGAAVHRMRPAKSCSSLKVTPSVPLRVQPSAKSNKTLVYNAIRDTCLAGGANAKQRQEALAELEKSQARHFIILFRDAGCQYRGLYTFEPDASVIERIHGIGPKTVRNPMIEHFFKYNSGSKRFSVIPTTQHLSVSVDAVSVFQNFWQQRVAQQQQQTQPLSATTTTTVAAGRPIVTVPNSALLAAKNDIKATNGGSASSARK